MTLRKGIIASQKSMRQQKVRFQGRRNPVEAKLAKNELFRRAVNKPAKWREIHGMIKEISEGGVYKNELRKLSDKLAHGNEARTIDHKAGKLIAEAIHQEFCPEQKKYLSYRNTSPKNAGFIKMKPSSKKASYQTTRPNSESKAAVAPANRASAAPLRTTTAKSQPAKHSIPGDSLKYEFAKPGLQSSKEPEKKKDVEIKPVAPEVYAKVLNMPQTATKDVEKKEVSPKKSTSSTPEATGNPSTPKEKKQEAAKPLSPENKEGLEFPKSTLSGDTDSVPEKKDLPAGTENTASGLNDISANKAIQTEALIASARKKMLDARRGGDSQNTKRGFSGAMAATMRNKQS